MFTNRNFETRAVLTELFLGEVRIVLSYSGFLFLFRILILIQDSYSYSGFLFSFSIHAPANVAIRFPV